MSQPDDHFAAQTDFVPLLPEACEEDDAVPSDQGLVDDMATAGHGGEDWHATDELLDRLKQILPAHLATQVDDNESIPVFLEAVFKPRTNGAYVHLGDVEIKKLTTQKLLQFDGSTIILVGRLPGVVVTNRDLTASLGDDLFSSASPAYEYYWGKLTMTDKVPHRTTISPAAHPSDVAKGIKATLGVLSLAGLDEVVETLVATAESQAAASASAPRPVDTCTAELLDALLHELCLTAAKDEKAVIVEHLARLARSAVINAFNPDSRSVDQEGSAETGDSDGMEVSEASET